MVVGDIYRFQPELLKEKLSSLTEGKQLAFGLACCERLWPNYLTFQKETEFGDARLLRTILETIWPLTLGGTLSEDALTDLRNSCEQMTPLSDNHDSLFTTAAQESCFSILYLLEYLSKRDVSCIIRIAAFARDSIDLYVQEIEDMDPNASDLETKILHHPLMQQELKAQVEDLNRLASTPILTQEFLNEWRSLIENSGIGNLGTSRKRYHTT